MWGYFPGYFQGFVSQEYLVLTNLNINGISRVQVRYYLSKIKKGDKPGHVSLFFKINHIVSTFF